MTASDGADGDNFGVAVTVDGKTVVVGSYQDDDNGSSSGSAYAFQVSDWVFIPDSAPGRANAASYTVTGLTRGIQYTFAIRAVNDMGVGPASEWALASPTLRPPVAPTSLTATPSDSITQVKLAWTASSLDGITKYQYRHSAAEGGSFPDEDSGWDDIPDSAPSEANETSYTVAVSDYGAPNAYEVRPFTDAAQGALTTLELGYLGSVTLAWDDPVDTTHHQV